MLTSCIISYMGVRARLVQHVEVVLYFVKDTQLIVVNVTVLPEAVLVGLTIQAFVKLLCE